MHRSFGLASISTLALSTFLSCFSVAQEVKTAEPPPLPSTINPTGTWKWEQSFGERKSERQITLVFEDGKLTGVYGNSTVPDSSGRRGAFGRGFDAKTDIANAKLHGDKITFDVTRQFGPNEFTTKFAGVISGDEIAGMTSVDFRGNIRESPWMASRVATVSTPIPAPVNHVAQPRNDANSKEAHRQLLEKTKQGTIDVYFQGDSITRRWGATDYPLLLKHWQKAFHGWNAANFAWGGDNTHHILWRMQNGELDGLSPKVFCLQAGANNLPWRGAADESHVNDVVDGIRAIIAEFRKRHPDVPIVLTAMFPRDQNPALGSTIDTINNQLEQISKSDRTLHWININPELVDSDGKLLPEVSSDGIHLEHAGYDVWGKALQALLVELLGPPGGSDNAPPPTGNPGR